MPPTTTRSRAVTLDELVVADGVLPFGQAAALGAGVAASLATQHAAGRVHGAVGPAGVVRGPSGNWTLALASQAPRDAVAVPPELRGRAGRFDATPAADLYGLGATLLFAVTGENLGDGGSSPSGAATVGDDERELLTSAMVEFLGLVRSLLATDPDARGSAEGAARQLARLAGLPPPPDPAALETPPAPAAAPAPVATAAAATVATGVAVAAGADASTAAAPVTVGAGTPPAPAPSSAGTVAAGSGPAAAGPAAAGPAGNGSPVGTRGRPSTSGAAWKQRLPVLVGAGIVLAFLLGAFALGRRSSDGELVATGRNSTAPSIATSTSTPTTIDTTIYAPPPPPVISLSTTTTAVKPTTIVAPTTIPTTIPTTAPTTIVTLPPTLPPTTAPTTTAPPGPKAVVDMSIFNCGSCGAEIKNSNTTNSGTLATVPSGTQVTVLSCVLGGEVQTPDKATTTKTWLNVWVPISGQSPVVGWIPVLKVQGLAPPPGTSGLPGCLTTP